MNNLPKEIYSDALRGTRSQLKEAKRKFKLIPTLENERKISNLRRRCSIYGERKRGCSE